MVVANATAVAVNQGGKRKGAVCGYMETFHRSIKEFLELRKNTGDERRRTHDMNTANWIPDLFMKRVYANEDWTLFSPDDAPDLHELYGQAFEEAYVAYEEKARNGKIKNHETLSAVWLWRKMLGLLFETGHPWITFKDPCNIRSPQQHVGVVHSSNLCTEITLNTSADEVAVCNLGSINLPQHIENGELNLEKLQKTINTAVRMLDNVIDINFYAIPQARQSNLLHRPIGLGLMGFQDALYKLGIDYVSQEAVEFADKTMETISYFAIQASTHLAEERGAYTSFEGSLWSQGILPIDSIELLEKARGKEFLKMDRSKTLDWDSLRERVKTVGMRNSNTMAIAPTATISNIVGVSQSIEPTYQNLYVKSNLSGEFIVINPYLVNDLKKLNLWDEVMVNDLKYYNGSVQSISRMPESLKRRYANAFEIDPTWLIEAASRRQKWIDQAQSLNLYMAQASGKKLDALYRLAWIRGLKTTYYLRSMAATSTEKSTITDSALNAVSANPVPQACSIDDPDCEACQ
ncbi:MAG: ribonucleoside-diphosphate reductase subunit alpha [Legionellales bacterium]|nr:ribonucleoside-diphosphate reductase subunit alpha [Legionellales bacterium]